MWRKWRKELRKSTVHKNQKQTCEKLHEMEEMAHDARHKEKGNREKGT
jgi:hypothetical protein